MLYFRYPESPNDGEDMITLATDFVNAAGEVLTEITEDAQTHIDL